MKYSCSKAQEAVEFILITAVVFLGALTAMFVFGGKMADFFTNGSSVTQVANQKAPSITSNTPITFQDDYKSEQPYTTTMVDGNEVRKYKDGSVAFMIEGNAIRLPTRALELQNTVIEATGGDGITDLVREIAYIIKKYKPADPQVEVFFGSGTRTQPAKSCSEDKFFWFSLGDDCETTIDKYVGDAKVQNVTINATVIKLDNHVILIQNDQSSSGSGNYKDKYRLEGDINPDNSFDATFRSYSKNITGTYSSMIDINDEGGLLFKNGSFQQANVPKKEDDDTVLWGMFGSVDTDEISSTGQWDFDFAKTIFNYELATKN